MQVLADPLALVDDREPLDLLVQPRVLDRDSGVQREHLDEALILLAELGARRPSWSGTGCRPSGP